MADAQIHPTALVESEAVGEDTRVWAFAHLQAGCVVGARCNVCDHVFIETGVTVGDGVTIKNGVALWQGLTVEDDVFIGPNAVFTNDRRPRAFRKSSPASWLVATTIGRGATIGANATVVCGCHVGAYAFVGAGAVVTSPVPAHALVLGNPARVSGWVCVCGERLSDDLACGCGKRYCRRGEGLAPART